MESEFNPLQILVDVKNVHYILYFHLIYGIQLYREAKSLPFPGTSMGPYFRKSMYLSQWREKDYLSFPFELCHELHI